MKKWIIAIIVILPGSLSFALGFILGTIVRAFLKGYSSVDDLVRESIHDLKYK